MTQPPPAQSPLPERGPSPDGAPPNNGFAVASLVCGIVGFVFGVGAVLAIVFGLVAKHQIRRSDGAQRGERLADWGIGLGVAWIAFGVYLIVLSIT